MSALERQFVQPNRADAFLFFFFDPLDQSGVEMLLRMHQLPWVKGLVLTCLGPWYSLLVIVLVLCLSRWYSPGSRAWY